MTNEDKIYNTTKSFQNIPPCPLHYDRGYTQTPYQTALYLVLKVHKGEQSIYSLFSFTIINKSHYKKRLSHSLTNMFHFDLISHFQFAKEIVQNPTPQKKMHLTVRSKVHEKGWPIQLTHRLLLLPFWNTNIVVKKHFILLIPKVVFTRKRNIQVWYHHSRG